MQLDQLLTILSAVEDGAMLSMGTRCLYLREPGQFAALVTLDNGMDRYIPLLDMTVSKLIKELEQLTDDEFADVTTQAVGHMASTMAPEEVLVVAMA